MDSSSGIAGWGAGPISVLKDLRARCQSNLEGSPGADSSSSDEGLTMSIRRQQASRSTAIAQAKLAPDEPLQQQPIGSLGASGGMSGNPTAQNLEEKFAAANGNAFQALVPQLLDQGVPQTPSGAMQQSIPPGLAGSGSIAVLQRTSVHLHSAAPLSPTPAIFMPALPPQTSAEVSPEQAPGRMEGGMPVRLSAEPYLINNPAFEAYLDTDSSDPDSKESERCTTPRSAIKQQVNGTPWLSQVQTFIGSPSQGAESALRLMARSAPPTMDRQPVQAALSAHAMRPAQDTSRVGGPAPAQRVLFRPSAPAAPPIGAAEAALIAALPGGAAAQQGEAGKSSTRGLTSDAQPMPACTDPTPNVPLARAADGGRLEMLSAAALSQEAAAAPSLAGGLPGDLQLPCGREGEEPAEPGVSEGGPTPAAGLPPHRLPAGEAAAAQAAAKRQPTGKRMEGLGAPVRLLACSRSDTLELPQSTVLHSLCQPDPVLPSPVLKKAPEEGRAPAALPAPVAAAGRRCGEKQGGNSNRRRGGFWVAARMLLGAALALLLLCGGLLLAGHALASSPQRIEQLALGSHGPTLAAWGRCMQRMRPAPEGTSTWDVAGRVSWRAGMRRLGGQLAVDSACAVSAVRRKALNSWAALRPRVGGWLSAAWKKGRQGAAVAWRHGGMAVGHMCAAMQPVGEKLLAFAQEHCPLCVGAMEHTARQSRRLLDAWLAGAPKHHSELYHGWLQRSEHVSAACTQLRSSATEWLQPAASIWRAQIAPKLESACEPVQAALHAAHALLEESAQAVVPDQEGFPLRKADSGPEQASDSARSGLAAAWRRVRSWVGGLLGQRSIGAGEPEQQEYSDAPKGAQEGVETGQPNAEAQHPPHKHVLRWPLPGGLEGGHSSQEDAEPVAEEVSHPVSQPLAQPEEGAGKLTGLEMPDAPSKQQQDIMTSTADGAAALEVGTTVGEDSYSGADAVPLKGGHAEGSNLSGMQEMSSAGSKPAALLAHDSASISYKQPQETPAEEEPIMMEESQTEGSSWPGADQPGHQADTADEESNIAVLEAHDSGSSQTAAEEHTPGAWDVLETDTQQHEDSSENKAESAAGTSQEASAVEATRVNFEKERAAASHRRGWASTLGWSAVSALVIGAVCAAAAAAISPEALLLFTPGPASRISQSSEQGHAPLLPARGSMRGPENPDDGKRDEQAAGGDIGATAPMEVLHNGCRIVRFKGSELGAPATPDTARRASTRRGMVRSAPATAPPLTRSRAARSLTAPGATDAGEREQTAVERQVPRRTRPSVGIDRGGRP